MENYSSLLHGLSILRPKPSPFALCRIGGDRDGAYLVPDDLKGITACFSPGVNNFKDFEDELTNRHGIACHMCDYSSDANKLRTPLIDGMQTFKKKWLDIDGSQNSISLEEWVNELEPNENHDLILQMDIEGAEYKNIIPCPEAILQRFRIIVLELHKLNVFKDENEFEKELGPLLRKLDNLFICVHAHPNNCCGEFIFPGSELNMPNLIEVTLLRKDRFSKGGELISPRLPHPLDISFNVAKNPPLFLNEKWTDDGVRSSESSIKMLHDELEYYKVYTANAKNNYKQTTSNLHTACQDIVIRLNGNSYNLTEGKLGCDVAQGKHFFLSTGYPGHPPTGVVKSKSPFFFHTNFGFNQFITIDLESEYELESLVIGNRTNDCFDRASCIFYVVHNTRKPDFALGLPVAVDKNFISTKNAKCTTPLMGARGRHLTIFSPENTALHFESIRIFERLL